MVAVSSRQKGQNERKYDHLSLWSCIDIVEVLGDGCQHWNKEVPWNEDIVQENRDEGYQ